MKAPHRQFFGQVRGTDPALADVHGWTFLEGEFPSRDDVVVLGRTAAAELFGEGFSAAGERVTIGERAFTVAGVVRTSDADQDETVFIPLTAGTGAAVDPAPAHDRPCRWNRRAKPRASPRTSPRCCASAMPGGGRRRRAVGLGGLQGPGSARHRRRLHREDAGGRQRHEGPVHVGRGVRAGQHGQARRSHAAGDVEHARAGGRHDDGPARQHRRHRAHRRRHRHHEHHARVGDRADQGDRACVWRSAPGGATCSCSSWSRRW